MPSLTRAEAAERAALLTVESYDIDLDLTTGDTTFRSRTTIRFHATPGAATFVELKQAKPGVVRLNGADLDPAALADNRIPLPDLAADNTLTVEADMSYTNTGEGLHRFVDPADGATYLYGSSASDDAQRMFACFDQPDLKAPVTLSVTAPPEWIVAANGAVVGNPRPGRWEFATTPPLATYFVILVAGPYHVLRDEHDGVPLGLYCRRSLAEHLDKDADEIFTITKQCLDRYHALFAERYPFGKYDQAFVPEFNLGAMENPGIVTFRDDFIFRSAVTESDRELRATVIAHEMAHMWFGDLVTLRWWDDLWLNESFAEYMGYRVTAEATRFRNAWTSFGIQRKAWGYAADQRPSTHPVAPENVADVAEGLQNLDGISYAKGAAVLRQLVAWVGDDAFLAGLRVHFARHRFGNATLADLLSALADASCRDLASWGRLWLREAQVNTLRAEVTVDDAGRYTDVAIVQTAPESHPVLRPHRIGIGLYDGGPTGTEARLRRRLEVDLNPDVDGGRTVIAELAGEPAAAVLLPNDGDLTYAKVRLDSASAAAVPLILPALPESLTRAVLWSETLDAVTDGERPVADLVTLVLASLPGETEVVMIDDVLRLSRRLIDRYLDPDGRAVALEHVAQACDRLMVTGPDDPSLRLAAARGLVAATADAGRLAGWLAGTGVPAGVVVDTDFRWLVLQRLAVLGAVGTGDIEAELATDRSATGAENAARCRAALPEPAAKQRAWQAIVDDLTLSNRLVEAAAQGFWQPEQAELTESYVERYFTDMPAMTRRRSPWVADALARLAFPQYAVSPRTLELADALLARDDVTPGLRRAVTDAQDDVRRALTARLAASPARAAS
jgi:aminopeptidase N